MAKSDFLVEPCGMSRALFWLCLLPLVLTACRKGKESRPVPAIEAYVWQDPDRPEVAAAIRQATDTMSAFHVRAAELRWKGNSFAVERGVQASLPVAGCGLVMRIGASASALDWTSDQIEAVADVVRSLALLHPREIQCDYDCPQKRLGRYHELLAALQQAAGRIPVIPTVLPSWLEEPAFGRLVADRPGYVLQVHSLSLPKHADQPVILFDPAAARIAVRRASSFNVPFRVAMATYGCEVWFGPDGKVIDVISEDAAPHGVVPYRRSFALADPVESAKLIREWTVDPPAGLQAVIWYRLPVEGDRRNWPWLTLQQACKGELGAGDLTLETSDHDGTSDLFVVNRGAFPLLLPSAILVKSPVTAADGAGACRIEHREDGVHFIRRGDLWPWLNPGKKIPIGWLRSSEKQARMDWQFLP